jgi:hypothetical protein
VSEILDKGYDLESFTKFLQAKSGTETGYLDIAKYTFDDLKIIISEYKEAKLTNPSLFEKESPSPIKEEEHEQVSFPTNEDLSLTPENSDSFNPFDRGVGSPAERTEEEIDQQILNRLDMISNVEGDN